MIKNNLFYWLELLIINILYNNTKLYNLKKKKNYLILFKIKFKKFTWTAWTSWASDSTSITIIISTIMV